jgi:hypothetical protein
MRGSFSAIRVWGFGFLGDLVGLEREKNSDGGRLNIYPGGGYNYGHQS